MILKVMMISLLAFASVAFASEWTSHTSFAGFYKIHHPKTWKITSQGNITNIVAPDGEGAITISAYHEKQGDFSYLMKLTYKAFAKAEVISPFKLYNYKTSEGVGGEFRQMEVDGSRRWLVRGVHSKHVFVLITANDQDKQFRNRKDTFIKILDSLELKDPQ